MPCAILLACLCLLDLAARTSAATALAFAGLHIQTLSGAFYNMSAPGEYYLLYTPTLQLQVRLGLCRPGSVAVCIHQLALQAHSHRLVLDGTALGAHPFCPLANATDAVPLDPAAPVTACQAAGTAQQLCLAAVGAHLPFAVLPSGLLVVSGPQVCVPLVAGLWDPPELLSFVATNGFEKEYPPPLPESDAPSRSLQGMSPKGMEPEFRNVL